MGIEVEMIEAGISLVTIRNEARRNALDIDDFRALANAWQQLADDHTVRAVVLTGSGHQAFCSGAQFGTDFTQLEDLDDLIERAMLKTCFFPKPLVAAVNGHCVAGGFELMLAADIRIASTEAKFGLPETHWGILPSGGGAMKLISQIGYSRAMQLLLTAELVSADDALYYGLVNSVLPPTDVLSSALKTARVIAANSPLAVRETKASAVHHLSILWKSLEAAERDRVKNVRDSPDRLIGSDAFLGKKKPQYPT